MAKNEEVLKDVRAAAYACGTNQQGVAELIGVTHRYLSDVINGRQPYSDSLREKIHGLCPSKESPDPKRSIPVFDIDFNGGFVERFNDTALEKVGSIDMPTYSKATAVVSVTGDSMHPLISSGDQIILREMPCVMESILYGGIYAVVTDNDLRTVKRIRRAAEPGCVDLEPINKDVADTTTIRFDRIIGLWRVMGCIKSLM